MHKLNQYHEIGMLWHVGTIDVSHERFVSELIKRKTIEHIGLYTSKTQKHNTASNIVCFDRVKSFVEKVNTLSD